MATPPLFREVQRFRQWIFYLPVIVVTGIIWWQFVEQIGRNHPQGSNPIPDWLAWIFAIVFGIGIPALAITLRLVTEVRPGVLSVRLAPFRPRLIAFRQIYSAEARDYSPIGEYGGWGVRVSKNHGRAYNAYGSRGVQLVLTDGSRILIGTQQPEELLAAMRLGGADID